MTSQNASARDSTKGHQREQILTVEDEFRLAFPHIYRLYKSEFISNYLKNIFSYHLSSQLLLLNPLTTTYSILM